MYMYHMHLYRDVCESQYVCTYQVAFQFIVMYMGAPIRVEIPFNKMFFFLFVPSSSSLSLSLPPFLFFFLL